MKDLTSNQWRIYDLLKEKAVGKENSLHAKAIIELLDLPYDERHIRKDIKAIRTNETITRKIGSCKNGYYLAVSTDEQPHRYLIAQIVSRIETAVNEGIPLSYFYQILNQMTEKNTEIDNQMRITFTKYEKDCIKKYSDDLKKCD